MREAGGAWRKQEEIPESDRWVTHVIPGAKRTGIQVAWSKNRRIENTPSDNTTNACDLDFGFRLRPAMTEASAVCVSRAAATAQRP